MLQSSTLNGSVVSITESTPVEKFVYEKLEELYDNFLANEIDLKEATKRMDFLIALKPYMDQEAEARKDETRNTDEISRNRS